MRSRSNGGIIGNYQLPTQNYANGVFFIHDAAIYNTGNNPIWPLGTGVIVSASGGTITTAVDNTNYKLHTFTANGTFTVSTGSGLMDILLVGGGGSGGYANNTSFARGGGGAGGQVLLMEQVYVSGPTTFSVEVGVGGDYTTRLNYTNYTAISGRPSRISSTAGHNALSYGGGNGSSCVYGSFYQNTDTRVNGGGQGAYNGLNVSDPGYLRNVFGTGSPGIVNNYVRTVGGAGSGLNGVYAGGGAGATEGGYSGYYSTDTNLRGAGGNGYQWSRTGYWYGGGGPGGFAYGYTPSYVRFGLCGTSGSRITSPQGLAYDNSNLSSDENGAYGMDYYGGGGQGGAVYSGGGHTGVGASGGGGGSGTVIFCYRYK